MLMEHETTKIKELDEQYQAELREWKAQLRPRKQVHGYLYLQLQGSKLTCHFSGSLMVFSKAFL